LSVIKKFIKDEKISEQQIDELVRQIVRTKLLFANRKDSIEYKKEFLGSKEHAALALEVAEKSAVLLKNKNSLLPIPVKMVQKILVVGSLADSRETGDRGSSWVKPKYVISPLEGIKKFLSTRNVEVLSVLNNNLDSIKKIAKDVDAVIVVAGTNFNNEGDYMGMGKIRDKANPDKMHTYVKMGFTGLGGDRNYLHLHQGDIDIIHAAASVSEHVVVVLRSGSAITVEEWYDKAPAILQTFYNGQEGGTALAKILFGDANPSGKLPFTLPKLESDLPAFNSFDTEVDYGYYHGYALFDKKNIEPRFPFGHGLSYTKFQILGMQIENKVLKMEDTLKVKVQLKNDSKRIGGEVLQLYVGFKGSSIDRPEQSLKAFEKIYLPARMEGSVTLSVPVRDLAFYNDISKKWEIEKMPYEIFIGTSSRSPEMLRDTVVVR
jgi:beta-glucosidase